MNTCKEKNWLNNWTYHKSTNKNLICETACKLQMTSKKMAIISTIFLLG